MVPPVFPDTLLQYTSFFRIVSQNVYKLVDNFSSRSNSKVRMEIRFAYGQSPGNYRPGGWVVCRCNLDEVTEEETLNPAGNGIANVPPVVIYTHSLNEPANSDRTVVVSGVKAQRCA